MEVKKFLEKYESSETTNRITLYQKNIHVTTFPNLYKLLNLYQFLQRLLNSIFQPCEGFILRTVLGNTALDTI